METMRTYTQLAEGPLRACVGSVLEEHLTLASSNTLDVGTLNPVLQHCFGPHSACAA